MLFFVAVSLHAQQKNIPIQISLYNESTAIPFTRLVTTPIHPGIQIGTEFTYKEREHFRLFQTVNLSYYFHAQLNHGISVNTELGGEYLTNSRFSFGALIGVGYLHTFATTKEYVFEDGHYTIATDKGNARIAPSLSLDVNYRINKIEPTSPKIFVRYQSWIEYPYSPGFIPLMSHINLHIGAKFNLPLNSGK